MQLLSISCRACGVMSVFYPPSLPADCEAVLKWYALPGQSRAPSNLREAYLLSLTLLLYGVPPRPQLQLTAQSELHSGSSSLSSVSSGSILSHCTILLECRFSHLTIVWEVNHLIFLNSSASLSFSSLCLHLLPATVPQLYLSLSAVGAPVSAVERLLPLLHTQLPQIPEFSL